MEEEKSVFEKLFDENDNSNIILYDENEEEVEFEQFAVIPIKEQYYAILRPVKKIEGLADDEALVFELEETEDGEELLNLVEDDNIIDIVFEEYEKASEE